ncbi:transporter, major facilitator family protein [delta proteobacterium NaphS2]|nr:transporter, major facilitator family protein [delta proteobacterium NaphS2]
MSRRWAIFLITSANFFLSQFYRATNAVIADQLLRDLSLDTKGLGTVSAAFFYAFSITQIPISMLLDRIGPRLMMTGLSLVGIAGAIIFAGSDSLQMGVLARILLGVGMACNLMGTLKLLTTWFSPTVFATLSGIVFSIGTLGNMAATVPMVLLVELVGWRQAFTLIAGVNLMLVMALWLMVRDTPLGLSHRNIAEPSETRSSALSGLLALFKSRVYWIISLTSFVGYGIFAAVQTLWAGPYLTEVMGLTVMNAGNVILMMNVGALIGGAAWGWLSDRVFHSRKWVILGGLIIYLMVLLVMVMISSNVSFVILMILFLSFGFFRSSGVLLYVHIKETMPAQMAGTAMTGINFFTMIGPAVFLQGMGMLMQHLYPHASRGPEAFRTSFLVCSALILMVSILYIFTKDTFFNNHRTL